MATIPTCDVQGCGRISVYVIGTSDTRVQLCDRHQNERAEKRRRELEAYKAPTPTSASCGDDGTPTRSLIHLTLGNVESIEQQPLIARRVVRPPGHFLGAGEWTQHDLVLLITTPTAILRLTLNSTDPDALQICEKEKEDR